MAFNVAGALIFGAILAFSIREGSGNGLHAFIAALFGFFLAGTGVAAPITKALHAIVTALSHIH